MEHNTYLIKALDAYPYDLEEALESLGYALSYEPENGMALCLMGRVYLEVYQDYDKAIEYFEKALENNLNMHIIYAYYASALICAEKFDKADKFLDFALSISGSDKALLLSRKVMIHESRQEFSQAKKVIKEAKMHAYNDGFMSYLDDVKSRIDKKIAQSKPKTKRKKTSKKSKKK